MDINSFIDVYYMPIVLVGCFCVGYVMKHWLPTDNKWIPTVMLVLGAVLGCIANGALTLENIVCGGVSGLASTGMHQMLVQLIENGYVATVRDEDEADQYMYGDDDDMEQE